MTQEENEMSAPMLGSGSRKSMYCDPPPREPDNRGPAVIVEGSVLGGFKFTGPFATIDDAAEWHKTKMLGGALGLDCTIALIEKPVQQVFPQ